MYAKDTNLKFCTPHTNNTDVHKWTHTDMYGHHFHILYFLCHTCQKYKHQHRYRYICIQIHTSTHADITDICMFVYIHKHTCRYMHAHTQMCMWKIMGNCYLKSTFKPKLAKFLLYYFRFAFKLNSLLETGNLRRLLL